MKIFLYCKCKSKEDISYYIRNIIYLGAFKFKAFQIDCFDRNGHRNEIELENVYYKNKPLLDYPIIVSRSQFQKEIYFNSDLENFKLKSFLVFKFHNHTEHDLMVGITIYCEKI